MIREGMMRISHTVRLATLCWVLCLGIVDARGDDFPARPITIIVPFGAGGGLDGIVRAVTQALPKELGQPAVIINRPGGQGIIGANAAIEPAADGYTLFFTSLATLNNALVRSFPFEVFDKFEPVAQAGSGSYCLFANSGVPVDSLEELVTYAKKNPNKLNYGAQAPSTTLGMEMLKRKADIDIQAIPFGGSGPAATALISDQIQLLIDGAGGSNLQFVDAGKIKPLACTDRVRSPVFPDIPTIEQAGYPGIVVTNTVGFWVRRGLDPERLKKLEAAIMKATAEPATVKTVAAIGYRAEAGTAAQLLERVKSERAFFTEAAKLSNYEPR
jgi:tripartite-type tricarboxylate transporter receptor subunit TctC